MYTIVDRRKNNQARQQETVQRAQSEFFPKLQVAPGFVGFYLVSDEANGINTAIIVWESKAQYEAFENVSVGWRRTLEELGHSLLSENRGETVIQLDPKK